MYFYHAHAVALGGVLERPSLTVPAQAACALPISGGTSSAIAGSFDNGLIKFDSAQSSVAGRAERRNGNNVYYTEVSVVVNRLNIGNRFAADQVVTQITAEHVVPVDADAADSEPDIIITGSHFNNLRIGGYPVTLETCHDVFHDLPTYQDCYGDWRTGDQSKLRKTLMGRTLNPAPGPDDPEHLREIHRGFSLQNDAEDLKPTVLCSFVKTVKGLDGTEINNGHSIIRIPKFGTIYLGEVIVCKGHRRVNMFRLQLGSPQLGGITGGGGSGNGTGFP